MRRKSEAPIGKFMVISGVMAGASIALVGIITLIAYEFFHANDTVGAREWMRTAHLATTSAIFFATSSIAGLTYESLQSTGKMKKTLKWITIGAFLFGWILMFIALGKIYLETW